MSTWNGAIVIGGSSWSRHSGMQVYWRPHRALASAIGTSGWDDGRCSGELLVPVQDIAKSSGGSTVVCVDESVPGKDLAMSEVS
jgi:hypothetical protein